MATIQQQRDHTENYTDDIEMNVLGANNEIDVLQPIRLEPDADRVAPHRFVNFPRLTTIIRFVSELHRPRFMLEMKETTAMLIITFMLVILANSWVMEPLGVSTQELYKHNWSKLCNMTSNWINAYSNSPSMRNAKPSYAPGFYLVPDVEVVPHIDQHYIANSMTSSHRGVSTTSLDKSWSTTDTVTVVEKRNGDNAIGLSHYAYPIHTGRIDDSPQSLQIRSQLEHCADNILTKIKKQALEVTPGFEFALHDCKSAIKIALDTFYPPDEPVCSNAPLLYKRSIDLGGVVPEQSSGTTMDSTSAKQLPKQELDIRSTENNTCSENFCDWVAPNTLDRCYYRDEIEYRQNGKIIYLNDSVDDFKDHAPLECNLCLPITDYNGIKGHCKELKHSEDVVMNGMIIGAGLCVFVVLLGVWAKLGWIMYRYPEAESVTYSIPLTRTRVPVMPVARRSSVSVRGGHLDKRAISSPVLIAHPAEGLEGAFENPRPAPLPPQA